MVALRVQGRALWARIEVRVSVEAATALVTTVDFMHRFIKMVVVSRGYAVVLLVPVIGLVVAIFKVHSAS